MNQFFLKAGNWQANNPFYIFYTPKSNNMKTRHLALFILLSTFSVVVYAQKSLSLNNVNKIYLQNTGTIMQDGLVKGYFLFYQSDKIDKKTNEYTLQILDENLNKVRDIKMQDGKNVSLLESAYNGDALTFLFYNSEEKSMETKVYSMDGKLKFSYNREIDKKTLNFIDSYGEGTTDEYENRKIFSLRNNGFLMLIPVRDGRKFTYEMDFYSSEKRLQWSYNPEDDERMAMATYLGNSDSVVVLEVTKRERLLGGATTSSVVGLNVYTHKKVFELDGSKDKFKFVPQYCTALKNTSNLLFMGSYYNKEDNLAKDFSQGLAIYIVSPTGEVISKTYNTWEKDFAKYLPLNEKGKIDNIGYLYFHNLIQAADGNLFAVGEGYKRVVDAVGVGMNVLSRRVGGGNTMIKVTDMVFMKFTPDFKVSGATIQEKSHNNFHTQAADFNSQHLIAQMIKMSGGFDYTFTTSNKDVSAFAFYYKDYERSKDFKGEVVHSIGYADNKVSTDRMELKSSASSLRVLPAKAGNVMILEYFRKDKTLNVHLEKMN